MESQRLCVHLLDRALQQLEEEGWPQRTVLGVFDLRGFSSRNADLQFVRFLVRGAAARRGRGRAGLAGCVAGWPLWLLCFAGLCMPQPVAGWGDMGLSRCRWAFLPGFS